MLQKYDSVLVSEEALGLEIRANPGEAAWLSSDVLTSKLMSGICHSHVSCRCAYVCTHVCSGQVEGVRVQELSSSSVNVSWIPLQSNDIANYLVDYFQMESTNSLVMGRRRRRQDAVEGGVAGRAEFPGSSSWGVVDGLRQGSQYEFQVTAAVLLNGGVRGEGKMRSLRTVESSVALTPAGMEGGTEDRQGGSEHTGPRMALDVHSSLKDV